MLPSARKGEECLCPAHGLGAVDKSAAGSVETNSRGQARGGDATQCTGGPIDFLVTGSGSVTVNSQPAARMSDKTMHRGLVVLGSGDVVIGGPTVGATLGNEGAGRKCCEDMAAGRNPPQGAVYLKPPWRAGKPIPGNTRDQSYNNCGVEVCRQIIHKATGREVGQEELLYWAIDHKQAYGTKDPATIRSAGGTIGEQQVAILEQHGVPAEQIPSSPGAFQQAAAERRGVIAHVYAGNLWPPGSGYTKGEGPHAVMVTGVEYDEHGDPKYVIINDTGMALCSQRVPADHFYAAVIPGAPIVITKQPIM
jgi:uncharacterized Zn-binding protein involved in type VI secretion